MGSTPVEVANSSIDKLRRKNNDSQVLSEALDHKLNKSFIWAVQDSPEVKLCRSARSHSWENKE